MSREVRLTVEQIKKLLDRLKNQLDEPLSHAERLETERRIGRLEEMLREERAVAGRAGQGREVREH